MTTITAIPARMAVSGPAGGYVRTLSSHSKTLCESSRQLLARPMPASRPTSRPAVTSVPGAGPSRRLRGASRFSACATSAPTGSPRSSSRTASASSATPPSTSRPSDERPPDQAHHERHDALAVDDGSRGIHVHGLLMREEWAHVRALLPHLPPDLHRPFPRHGDGPVRPPHCFLAHIRHHAPLVRHVGRRVAQEEDLLSHPSAPVRYRVGQGVLRHGSRDVCAQIVLKSRL
jgi:hypothetical protein